MTRSRRTAREAGTRFERSIADYLKVELDDRIDRRVKTGAKDRGDIGGVRTPFGGRLVVECKDAARFDLAGWVTEAHVEAANDDAHAGIVVAKRRGHGHPGAQYVICTLDDILALLRPAGTVKA